jgi:hypothetical protein
LTNFSVVATDLAVIFDLLPQGCEWLPKGREWLPAGVDRLPADGK